MIRKNELITHGWPIYLLLALIAVLCIPGSYANAEDSLSLIVFEGSWTVLQEKEDCNGESSEVNEITIEQKNTNKVYLTLVDGQDPLKCEIIDDELQCSGKIKFEDGSYLDVSESSFTINDEQNLEGVAEWVLYDAEKNACQGQSLFSPVPSDLYFEGNWEVTEALTGCNLDGYVDTNSATIIQSGGEATFSINGEVFDCTVIVDSGLHCSGEIVLDDGIIMDYFQAIFWFDGDDNLLGNADWAMYSGTTLLCYGESTMSAIRSLE